MFAAAEAQTVRPGWSALASDRTAAQPGDSVTLTLWRNGQSRKQAVVLGKPE